MTLRLLRLEIEAFRGIADPVVIDLDADAILVIGSNGVGKTSIVDAILWVLTGRLSHLEVWRRRQNDEVIANAYSHGRPSRVALVAAFDGIRYVLERTGNSSSSGLAVSPAGDIDPPNPSPTLAALLGVASDEAVARLVDRATLQQADIRSILQASPNELHDRLRELLGLGVIDALESDLEVRVSETRVGVKDATNRLNDAERRLSSRRAELQSIDESLARSPDMTVATSQLALAEASNPAVSLIDAPSDLQATLLALRAAYEALRAAKEQLPHIEQDLAALPADDPTAAEALGRSEAALATAVEDVAGARRVLADIEGQAAAAELLASAALPLLSDACPVCGQAISEHAVRQDLQQRLGARPGSSVLEARQSLAQAVARHVESERDFLVWQARVATLGEALARRRSLLAHRDEIIASLNVIGRGRLQIGLPDELNGASLSDLMRSVTELGQAVREVASASQSGSLGLRRTEIATAIVADEAAVQQARIELETAARRSASASSMLKGVREASVRVVERAMKLLNPRFSEVYRRLAPHPTFTDLGFMHDLYRSKGRSMPIVRDPLWEIDQNPAVVCSVGQLNVVALSYFLAFAMSDRSAPVPFVVMDDPLQSLDDVNALGFADFCRRLKSGRQVILTTHDPRFAALLRRKLSPTAPSERLINLELEAWDRSGPTMLFSVAEAPVLADSA